MMKRVIYIYLWAVATYICLRSSLSLKLHFPQKFQSFWAFSLICILPFKTTHSSQWVSIKVMKKNKSERESRCGWDQGYHYKKKPSKSIQTDISTSPKKFHREREESRFFFKAKVYIRLERKSYGVSMNWERNKTWLPLPTHVV